jgi:lipopolysaccharide biosynthesis glycosyltransferase
MNILLCSDNTYAPHLAATISSVVSNNSNVNFYVLTLDFSEYNKKLIERFVIENGSSIFFIYINDSLISGFPMSTEASNHISIETYLRLFAEHALPATIDKLIYLDSDIIVRHSLVELWNQDVSDFALGAVYQYNEWSYNNDTFSRLKYNKYFGYFNAGVLLINLVYWRENNVTKRLIEFINTNHNSIISHDQDTLNAVLYKETLPLECKWNVLPFFLGEELKEYTFPKFIEYFKEVETVKANPSVVHFVSKPKPWEYGCNNVWKSEYFKYLDLTPWSGQRPKFKFSLFVKFFCYPFFLKTIKKISVKIGLKRNVSSQKDI